MGELIRPAEVQEALEARRELGPEYDEALAEALAEKVEARIEERLARLRPPGRGAITPLAISSLALGIPITAVAGGTGGAFGVAVAWIGIAAVNLAAALYGRR